jgi:STE24 endopeptidase
VSLARGPVLLALIVLAFALALTVALTTPWDALPASAREAGPGGDFTPAEQAREVAFHDAVRPPAYLSLGIGLLVTLVLGLTPLGARLVTVAARPLGGGWGAQAAVGTVVVLLVPLVVALPLDARAEVVLRRYGLSTQTWGSWLLDRAKGFGLAAVVSVAAVVGLYALARRLPGTWWLWAAGAGAALTVVLSFAYPLVVEPLFNRFTPMPAGELRDSLLELAQRDGVAVDEVLVADASRRTTALNAYVSGIGATRRIVVYDTLLARATPDEVRLVVAHELGHVAEHDVRDGTLTGALGVALGVCALALALSWAPLLRRAGIDGPADPRGVALLVALVAVATFVARPAVNLVSRRVEARADTHALDLTRDPATAALSERRLALTNLSDLDPNPVSYLLFATHPSAVERIEIVRAWAREHGAPVPGPLADAVSLP